MHNTLTHTHAHTHKNREWDPYMKGNKTLQLPLSHCGPFFFCPAPIVAQFDTAAGVSASVSATASVAVDVRSKFVVI